MLEKIKKHSAKIFVFAINILLAAVAVFIIREKDQARLLEKARDEKENLENAQAEQEPVQSFENSVDFGDQAQTDGTAGDVSESAEAPIQTPAPAPVPAVPVVPPAPASAVPETAPPKKTTPAPAPQKKPADTKTKTS